MIQSIPSAAKGFTLIELLVAITITALIGVGVWHFLGVTLRSQEVLERQTESLDSLQRILLLLDRDMQQVTVRPVRNQFGDQEYALSNRNTLYKLELTRNGWRNPLQHKRSSQQRVAYELHESTLLRTSWKVLDLAHDSEPRSMELSSDIESFEVAFLHEKNNWVDEWPPDSVLGNDEINRYIVMPKAIRITMEHRVYGEIYRLYELPVAIQNEVSEDEENGSESGSGSEDDETQSGEEGSENDETGSENGDGGDSGENSDT